MQEQTENDLLCLSLGGGKLKIDGFKTVDLDASANPDFLMDITCLEFPSHSVDVIYASHVLEHLRPSELAEDISKWDYLKKILMHWRGVLKPDGHLFVAVPNLRVLAQLLVDYHEVGLDKTFIDTIYGGWRTSFDYHYSGFTEAILSDLLQEAGFCEIETCESFVADESAHTIMGQPISLNMKAKVNAQFEQRNVGEKKSSRLEGFLKKLFLRKEPTELEMLRKICDERLVAIIKVNDAKEALLKKLAKYESVKSVK